MRDLVLHTTEVVRPVHHAAFLGPDFVRAAIDARLPRGINVRRIATPELEWSRQWTASAFGPDRRVLAALRLGRIAGRALLLGLLWMSPPKGAAGAPQP